MRQFTTFPEIKLETSTLLIIARPANDRVMVIHKILEWAYFMSCEQFCAICDRVTKPK